MKKIGKSISGADLIERIRKESKPVTICPACGVEVATLPNSEPHHRWNGNMFDSRLICPSNNIGVRIGEEFKQE